MSCGLILFLVKRIEGGDEALCGEEGDVRRSMAVRRIQLWWRGSIKAKSPHKYVEVESMDAEGTDVHDNQSSGSPQVTSCISWLTSRGITCCELSPNTNM